ncbi:GAF domain-containing protein [Rhizomicrobium electricum]|jgi:GAF domain-containing protein|uniref:GAF domain-containing protein n=1 Tax=Rhizomicrobium electricum TaxID=480070 RepID=A0ABP3PE67_9PROT|nr:GAF domain-containing protein [Rhizomicrobium electricum]NIJ48552.1 GAF domain-containing protein [Rhizomicrobium electricum]
MDKAEIYRKLEDEARNRAAGERNPIANAANFAALMWEYLPDINWAGFYFRKGRWLVLGPFMGKPACTRLQVGLGVCGTAVAEGKTLVVPDVHQFAGHVACDAASNSELVVPLFKYSTIIGVIDIDSPSFGRFDEVDAKAIESLGRLFMLRSDDVS